MHVRNLDSIPSNVEMFGWWDLNTVALAKQLLAEEGHDVDLTKGRVLIGQTNYTYQTPEPAYILVYASENLYILGSK